MSEEKEQPHQQPPQPEVEFVVPDPKETLFTTYANNVRLAWTHFDVRMLFGEIIDSNMEKIIVEERAQITISYRQAKLLMLMLAQAIAQHESLFGEVKVLTDATAFSTMNIQATVPPGASHR
jgi:hypothetical protein